MKKFTIKRVDKINIVTLHNIIRIIKSVNKDSIISTLSYNDLNKFLISAILNKHCYIFTASFAKVIIGYIIYTDLKYEFLCRKNKLYFLLSFIKKIQIISIINIFLKVTNLDKFYFTYKNKIKYNNSINLSYLGISKDFQSQGIGKKLIFDTIKLFNPKKIITVETYNSRAQKFYMNKCKFKKIGDKVQLFKRVEVYFYNPNSK